MILLPLAHIIQNIKNQGFNGYWAYDAFRTSRFLVIPFMVRELYIASANAELLLEEQKEIEHRF